MDTRLLNTRDICELLQISRTTLHRAVRDGGFVMPIRVGRRGIRWRESDIRDWIASREPVLANGIEVSEKC